MVHAALNAAKRRSIERAGATRGTSPSLVHDESTALLEQAELVFDETLPSLHAATEAMQTTLNDVLDLQHIESG